MLEIQFFSPKILELGTSQPKPSSTCREDYSPTPVLAKRLFFLLTNKWFFSSVLLMLWVFYSPQGQKHQRISLNAETSPFALVLHSELGSSALIDLQSLWSEPELNFKFRRGKVGSIPLFVINSPFSLLWQEKSEAKELSPKWGFHFIYMRLSLSLPCLCRIPVAIKKSPTFPWWMEG